MHIYFRRERKSFSSVLKRAEYGSRELKHESQSQNLKRCFLGAPMLNDLDTHRNQFWFNTYDGNQGPDFCWNR